MNQTVETGVPLVMAVVAGMILLLLLLGFVALIIRLAIRRPSRKPPLVPSADGHFEVVGKRIRCFHCGGHRFKAEEILLNTWLLSLLRIDWLDSSATVLTCESCGRLTWFAQEEPVD
jgi:predicted nucleic-acid-binding Zn-ribbon protein